MAQNYSNLFWNIGGWVKCKSGWPRCDDLLKLLVVVGGEGQAGETDPGWDPVDHDALLERTRVKVLNSRVIERLKSVANWCDVTRLRLALLWLCYGYPTLGTYFRVFRVARIFYSYHFMPQPGFGSTSCTLFMGPKVTMTASLNSHSLWLQAKLICSWLAGTIRI